MTSLLLVLRRDHFSLIPACFSMLFKVPIGMSRFGCGTVTLPFFVGCLNCLWLPTCFTSCRPSFWICFTTSRLCMFPRVAHITTIHTFYTLINIKIHILPHSRTPPAQVSDSTRRSAVHEHAPELRRASIEQLAWRRDRLCLTTLAIEPLFWQQAAQHARCEQS